MIHENFGACLKKFRRSHQFTQYDISKLLNISRQAYSNYEQGRCLPPPDTLADLSFLLNTNLFILFLQTSSFRETKPLPESEIQDIPEEEKRALLDIYSHMPIERRAHTLDIIIRQL